MTQKEATELKKFIEERTFSTIEYNPTKIIKFVKVEPLFNKIKRMISDENV
jgi:hypothetical protein